VVRCAGLKILTDFPPGMFMSFLRVLGLAALAACLAVRPPFVDAEGIVAYLASVLVAGAITDFAIVPVLRRVPGGIDAEDAKGTRDAVAALSLRDLLRALSEDGLYYVPLLLAGPNPILAQVMATAVGTLHFPRRSLRECVWKGVHVFLVAVFVLPYGIAVVALGHLLALAIVHRPWSPRMLWPLAAPARLGHPTSAIASRTEALR
jgi:hypothetical protein